MEAGEIQQHYSWTRMRLRQGQSDWDSIANVDSDKGIRTNRASESDDRFLGRRLAPNGGRTSHFVVATENEGRCPALPPITSLVLNAPHRTHTLLSP